MPARAICLRYAVHRTAMPALPLNTWAFICSPPPTTRGACRHEMFTYAQRLLVHDTLTILSILQVFTAAQFVSPGSEIDPHNFAITTEQLFTWFWIQSDHRSTAVSV